MNGDRRGMNGGGMGFWVLDFDFRLPKDGNSPVLAGTLYILKT